MLRGVGAKPSCLAAAEDTVADLALIGTELGHGGASFALFQLGRGAAHHYDRSCSAGEGGGRRPTLSHPRDSSIFHIGTYRKYRFRRGAVYRSSSRKCAAALLQLAGTSREKVAVEGGWSYYIVVVVVVVAVLLVVRGVKGLEGGASL